MAVLVAFSIVVGLVAGFGGALAHGAGSTARPPEASPSQPGATGIAIPDASSPAPVERPGAADQVTPEDIERRERMLEKTYRPAPTLRGGPTVPGPPRPGTETTPGQRPPGITRPGSN